MQIEIIGVTYLTETNKGCSQTVPTKRLVSRLYCSHSKTSLALFDVWLIIDKLPVVF